MILADTSAWVAFLRDTGSAAHHALRDAIEADDDVVTTDVVIMEVLSGARDAAQRNQLRRLMHEFPCHAVGGLETYEAASDIYLACRRAGTTPRQLADCLVAAVAMRDGLTVLHEDRDFDAIALHVGLSTSPG